MLICYTWRVPNRDQSCYFCWDFLCEHVLDSDEVHNISVGISRDNVFVGYSILDKKIKLVSDVF
jgi:hypothetical protein